MNAGIKKCDIAVIGGGPAGLAATVAAKKAGGKDVLLIERDRRLGGILGQCIHDGFGLHRFKEALSGPEYAARYIELVKESGAEILLNTIVLDLDSDKNLLVSAEGEMSKIEAGAVVLAMGCRERARGALSIPGHRPSGVYTAGAAQNFVNMENIMPGSRVVILGSGDIGLIMARRMTLEGAKVEAVFELLPYSSGLPRNIQQCLVDYGIPLHLSTTVVEIHGMERLEGVTVAEVDEKRLPIKATRRYIPCDTLLLSVGLIPENELAREAGIEMNPVTGGPVVNDRCMTSVPGIFSCGNALHVHDLVDWVSEEAEHAGAAAAEYLECAAKKAEAGPVKPVKIRPGRGVRYVMPDRIERETISRRHPTAVMFRVTAPSRSSVVRMLAGDKLIKEGRHARLHPAEMVRMTLSVGDMEKVGHENLEVMVE